MARQTTWNSVALLARSAAPVVTCPELPGGADDMRSRYSESGGEQRADRVPVTRRTAIRSRGPKFDYELALVQRLITMPQRITKLALSVVPVGDFNASTGAAAIPRSEGGAAG